MRKPTNNEIYMYKNLFWVCVGAFVFVPVFNNFFLQMIVLFTEGDLAYGKFSSYVAAIQDIIGLVASYVGLGAFVVCLINFGKNSVGVIFLAFLSHIITFVASMFTYFIYGGSYFFTAVFMLSVDMLINLAVYFIIYLVLLRIVKKKETILNVPEYRFRVINTQNPLTLAVLCAAGLYGVFQLVAILYRMIGDFLDPSLGPPVNLADTLYWVLEYVTVIVGVVIGYFIMLAVCAFAKHFLKFKRINPKNISL